MTRDTITREEFEHRLDAANERLRQELADAQERVRRLDDLIHRKEAFSRKLDVILGHVTSLLLGCHFSDSMFVW